MNLKYLVETVAYEFRKDMVAFQSAALSFYILFSIIPLVILFLYVAGRAFGELFIHLIDAITAIIGVEAWAIIEATIKQLQSTSQGMILYLIVIGVIIYIASRTFYFIQKSMNMIWDINPHKRWFREEIYHRAWSLLLIGILGAIVIAIMILNVVLVKISSLFITPIAYTISFLGTSIIMFILLMAIYKFVPDRKIQWKDVWLGSVFSTIVFWIGYWLYGMFLFGSNLGSIYGATSAVLISLIWIYFLMQVFLIGAEVTKVYAHKYGSLKPKND